MRKRKQSPEAYADCKAVMDIALTNPGTTYTLPTPGRAVHFKQRCNAYRNLLREIQAEVEGNIPGLRPSTPYDRLVIRQINNEGKPDAKHGCIVLFDHEAITGELRDAEGNIIHLNTKLVE